MLNLDTREVKLTDAEFATIERNEEGRILGDFDMVWIWATKDQKDRMHEDDWSRGQDLEDDFIHMMAEFC